MYFISLLDIKILKEVCPLSVNILAYYLSMIFVIFLALFLTFPLFNIIKRVWNSAQKDENMMNLMIIINLTTVLRILCVILPEWLVNVFSWINVRIIHLMTVSSMILWIIGSSIAKWKFGSNISNDTIIALVDFSVYLIIKYYWLLTHKLKTNLIALQAMPLLVILYIISHLQSKYGSRFLLPNRFRTKLFEYRRRIVEDFDIAKMDQCMFPEWDLCLQKLNLASLYSNDRCLAKILQNLNCNIQWIKSRN